MPPLQTGNMHKEEFYNLLENQDLLNEESVQILKNYTFEYPWFNLGWMLYLKNLKKINSPEYEIELPKVAIRVPNRKVLFNFLHSELNFKPEQKIVVENEIFRLGEEKQELEKESLIDKFLLTGPAKIKPVGNSEMDYENVDTEKIIENSVSEKDELITETLANIYFQQKNYNKAIESFQKLSLKYPEKSVYFASRIEEIEKIKNN